MNNNNNYVLTWFYGPTVKDVFEATLDGNRLLLRSKNNPGTQEKHSLQSCTFFAVLPNDNQALVIGFDGRTPRMLRCRRRKDFVAHIQNQLSSSSSSSSSRSARKSRTLQNNNTHAARQSPVKTTNGNYRNSSSSSSFGGKIGGSSSKSSVDLKKVASRVDTGIHKASSSSFSQTTTRQGERAGNLSSSFSPSSSSFSPTKRELQYQQQEQSQQPTDADLESLRRAHEDLQSKYQRKSKQCDSLRQTNEKLKSELANREELLQQKWQSSMDLDTSVSAAGSLLQSAKRSMHSALSRDEQNNNNSNNHSRDESKTLLNELYSEINVLQMAESKISQLEDALNQSQEDAEILRRRVLAFENNNNSGKPSSSSSSSSSASRRQESKTTNNNNNNNDSEEMSSGIIQHLEEKLNKATRENAQLKQEVRMYSDTLSHTLEEYETKGGDAGGFTQARQRFISDGRLIFSYFEKDASRVSQVTTRMTPQCAALAGILRQHEQSYISAVSTLQGEYKTFAKHAIAMRVPMQDIRALSDELRSSRASTVLEQDPLARVELLHEWTTRVERATKLLLELQSQVHFFTIHKEGNLQQLTNIHNEFNAAHGAVWQDVKQFQKQLSELQSISGQTAKRVQQTVNDCFVNIGAYLQPIDRNSVSTQTSTRSLNSIASPSWNQRFIYEDSD